ncbi:MAG: hypothetical protein NUW37_14480 [Planctomycetes bacterium]|nr:hypothetical protein [Planctomycetota bacterium]
MDIRLRIFIAIALIVAMFGATLLTVHLTSSPSVEGVDPNAGITENGGTQNEGGNQVTPPPAMNETQNPPMNGGTDGNVQPPANGSAAGGMNAAAPPANLGGAPSPQPTPAPATTVDPIPAAAEAGYEELNRPGYSWQGGRPSPTAPGDLVPMTPSPNFPQNTVPRMPNAFEDQSAILRYRENGPPEESGRLSETFEERAAWLKQFLRSPGVFQMGNVTSSERAAALTSWLDAFTYYNRLYDPSIFMPSVNENARQGENAWRGGFTDIFMQLNQVLALDMNVGTGEFSDLRSQMSLLCDRFFRGAEDAERTRWFSFWVDNSDVRMSNIGSYYLGWIFNPLNKRSSNQYAVTEVLLAALESFGLNARPVALPDRLLVRVDRGGEKVFIDVAKGSVGFATEDEYKKFLGLSDSEAAYIFRPLNEAEYVSLLETRIADIIFKQGSLSDARNRYRLALVLDPYNREALVGEAECLLRQELSNQDHPTPHSRPLSIEELRLVGRSQSGANPRVRSEAVDLLERAAGVKTVSTPRFMVYHQSEPRPTLSKDYTRASTLLAKMYLSSGSLEQVMMVEEALDSIAQNSPLAVDPEVFYLRALAASDPRRGQYSKALEDIATYTAGLGRMRRELMLREPDPNTMAVLHSAWQENVAEIAGNLDKAESLKTSVEIRSFVHALKQESMMASEKLGVIDAIVHRIGSIDRRKLAPDEIDALQAVIDELGSSNQAYVWQVSRKLSQVFGVDRGTDKTAWQDELRRKTM